MKLKLNILEMLRIPSQQYIPAQMGIVLKTLSNVGTKNMGPSKYHVILTLVNWIKYSVFLSGHSDWNMISVLQANE